MTRVLRLFGVVALAGALLASCGSDEGNVAMTSGSTGGSGGQGGAGGQEPAATVVRFDLDADVGTSDGFYDLPFPSDLRLKAGKPDLTGFPLVKGKAAEPLLPAAIDRDGWPIIASAYFRFSAPLAKLSSDEVIAADEASPVLLVDVDPTSPERGKLFPTVAAPLEEDGFAPAYLLGVAAFPGVLLMPSRTYAFVVKRSLNDGEGRPLGVPAELATLASGEVPGGEQGAAAAKLYAPLFATLDTIGVDRGEVAAATVFTTGDVAAETLAVGDAIVDKYDVVIEGLELDADDGGAHERFCELHGTVKLPQFQPGTPAYDNAAAGEGLWDRDEQGIPKLQREEVAPIVITLPKSEMPTGGYPLLYYIHGSGGVAAQVVDRGKIAVKDGAAEKGKGPAHVVAEHGFAAFGAAMPLNPERSPKVGSFDYININNLGAFSYTFRQGAFEQRLIIEALAKLAIDPELLAGCSGPTLPPGKSAFSLDVEPLHVMGQSMGAQYTNIVGATEKRVGAVVPTGSGGHWQKFMTVSPLYGGVKTLAASYLGTKPAYLDVVHPALYLLMTAWEAGDALTYLPRLARNPFEGHPARDMYSPVAPDDEFFPTVIYDAMAMGFHTQQAGPEQWASMQAALGLVGLDGIADYPVKANRESAVGKDYTAVVVQFLGDGIADPHTVFSQLDEVKYQYGCFLKTFRDNGRATVPSPASLGTPCP